MRKPPIFLDKPIAGAIIRQTDRQNSAVRFCCADFFARARCVRGHVPRACRALFVCAGKGGAAADSPVTHNDDKQ